MEKKNIFKIIIICMIMIIIGVGISKYISFKKVIDATHFNSSEYLTKKEKIQNLIKYNNETMDNCNMDYDPENELITLSFIEKDFDEFSDVADLAKAFDKVTEKQKNEMKDVFLKGGNDYKDIIRKQAIENFAISDFDNTNFRIIYLDSQNNKIGEYYNGDIIYTIYDDEISDESYIKDNSKKIVNPTPISREEAIKKITKEKDIDTKYSDVFPYKQLDKVQGGITYYNIEIISKDGKGAAVTYYINSQTGEIIKGSDFK